jgi:hypothetical protein
VNSHTVSGPPSTVWVVDVESILERRRFGRPSELPDDEPPDAVEPVIETLVGGKRWPLRWPRRRA